jgi:hypothetical protein
MAIGKSRGVIGPSDQENPSAMRFDVAASWRATGDGVTAMMELRSEQKTPTPGILKTNPAHSRRTATPM